MTSYELSQRTAVVTGAASGMGAAIATLLGNCGARVALLSRRPAPLEQLARAIGDRAIAVPTDITEPASLDRAVGIVHEQLGPVDLVVNAAGVMLPNPVTAGRTDEWRSMVETNLMSALNVARVFTSDLLGAAGPTTVADFVIVSSVAAHTVLREYAVYGATKAAVTHLADALRPELGPAGVRVTTIEPGLTATELSSHIDNAGHSGALAELLSQGQHLDAADIADLVGYVASRPRHVNLGHVVITPTERPA